MASRVCVHLFYWKSFTQPLQKKTLRELITAYREAIEFSAETEAKSRWSQLEPFQSEGGR
jgi:hypothetical protein